MTDTFTPVNTTTVRMEGGKYTCRLQPGWTDLEEYLTCVGDLNVDQDLFLLSKATEIWGGRTIFRSMPYAPPEHSHQATRRLAFAKYTEWGKEYLRAFNDTAIATDPLKVVVRSIVDGLQRDVKIPTIAAWGQVDVLMKDHGVTDAKAHAIDYQVKRGIARAILPAFRRALELYPKGKVDMGSTERPECGTPGCHAGWFGVGYDLGYAHSKHFWEEAGDSMAYECGFVRVRELERWAETHPQYWGNQFGFNIFNSVRAFKPIDNTPLTVQDFYDHWKGVYGRIPGEIVAT